MKPEDELADRLLFPGEYSNDPEPKAFYYEDPPIENIFGHKSLARKNSYPEPSIGDSV